MIVHNVQVRKHNTYHIFDHTVQYDADDYDIGLGYIDTTSAFLTWSPTVTPPNHILNHIKTLNPTISRLYTVAWYWDNETVNKLINMGFQFEEVSAVGDPSELCLVYEYP